MTIRVMTGDCRDILKTLPDSSVQMCCTSPPYFGLRAYLPEGHPDKGKEIGLEASPDLFVAEMVAVFREVRRVLRDDATLWLNLGDSYASGGGSGIQGNRGQRFDRRHTQETLLDKRHWPEASLKPKDLMMIPARVALALQADGWWLRSDIIWAKKNCMPESVTDRPSSAHEHVFLLTKAPQYYYDAEAIREEGVIPAGTRAARGSNVRSELKDVNGRPPEYWDYTGTRNSRNVWSIATKPFADAHFATFPPALAERCIKAGTSEKGCCSACGAPWMRVTITGAITASGGKGARYHEARVDGSYKPGTADDAMTARERITTGWQPTCQCNGPVVPCTVLDPFAGAFTSLLVADRLQRDGIGIELNPAYAEMARKRLTNDAPLFAEVAG